MPIAKVVPDIEDAMINNGMQFISGPTRSGKTTQLPQIAAWLRINGLTVFDEIIATLPRVVGARTLSERIGSETAESGENYAVGYYTSGKRPWRHSERKTLHS